MGAISGVNKVFGYALSMILLAVASLVAIPALIRASGDAAWGAIAVGQSIGAVAAVGVAYGWSMSGPAEVARGTADDRLIEYFSSLKVRLTLLLPVLLGAVGVALLLAPTRKDLAALGAVTATLAGLTANWFFVGLARPYVLLLLETLPRVAGTTIGIVLMFGGADAWVGLACQGIGFVAAFAAATAWILAFLRRSGASADGAPGLAALLKQRGDGLVSALGSAAYVAAPILIVSVVAPGVQAMYALVDKFQRQVSVAAGPAVTVLQGWVPRGRPMARRAQVGLLVCTGLALLGWGILILIGRTVLGWLGAGELHPSWPIVVLMGAFVAVNFLESVVAKVVLATYRRLRVVAKATIAGAIVGFPAVALGAAWLGAEGALAGVLLGLVIRLGWELAVAVPLLRVPGQE